MSKDSSLRKINCRRCGNETVFAKENVYRPFCSERCKMIDLGLWANEEYRVPTHDLAAFQELAQQLEEEDSRRGSEENFKKN